MNTPENVNQDFSIPEDKAVALRRQAEALVAQEANEDTLLAQFVEEARAKKETELREKAAAIATDKPQDLDQLGFPAKYMEINIYKGSPNEKALSYVPVSVQGYAWKIQRGVPVIVHSVVVDALNHAITADVDQVDGGLILTPVHRFPYQIIRANVPQEEYRAFSAKNKAAGVKAAVL